MRASLVVASLLVLPALARAQEGVSPGPPPAAPAPAAPVDPTVHRHLGFFFHLDVGGGYFTTSTSQSGVSLSASGAAMLLSLAVGGAVGEDWILAGELWGTAAPSPGGSIASGATIGLSGVGLNVTHYFMPLNLFLSLTPSATVVSIDTGNGGTAGRTELGFGAKVALGKEWWVGDHWGLGVALQASFGINKDQGTAPPTWTSFGGGVVFSATYN